MKTLYKTSPNTVGKRLSIFLEKRFPEVKTQKAMSALFGFKNTTVISWCENRDMPQEAYKRLLELGCDLEWLLTGNNKEANIKNAPPVNEGEALSMVSPTLSDAIKNATEIRQLLDDAQNRVFQGRLSAEEFEGITEDLLAAIESSLTTRSKSRHDRSRVHDSGA